VERGDAAAVQVLLDAGAYVDVRHMHNATPLYNAGVSGHNGTMQVLIDAKASFDLRDDCCANLLLSAAACGDNLTIQRLLCSGTNVNVPEPSLEFTALHLAP